jgi:hypothetical protein
MTTGSTRNHLLRTEVKIPTLLVHLCESPFKDRVEAMMIAVGKTNPVTVSRPVVEAATWRASYLADLTVTALQKIGLAPDAGCAQPLRLPANLLLEFGAVLQLAHWEQDGFTAHLDAGLPFYADAFAELVAKTEQGLWDNEVIPSDTLAFKVFRLSMDEFSWDAPSLLGIDVQLQTDNEDEFVERLAEFLWRNHKLKQSAQQMEGIADGS